jgi:hypothetical protein
MYDGKRAGSLLKLMPGLVGYLASFGALTNSQNFAEMVYRLSACLGRYATDSGKTLSERIAIRHEEMRLL